MKKLVQFVIVWSVVAIPATPALCLTDMGEISCGQTLSGSIDAAAQMDTWTFYGQAGDRVLMSAKATSGSLYPYMVWYAPDGSEEVSGAQFLDHELGQTGTYTVVLYDGYTGYGDDSLQDTGGYNITFLNLPGCPWATISCDETQSDTIDLRGDMDVRQFEAAAGDRVLISAKATSAGLLPQMVLYGPDYSHVVSAKQFLDEVLSDSGTYTLVLYDGYSGYGDDSLQDTGGYNITFLNLPGCPWATISCDETQSDTIDPRGDMDVRQFDAAAGERVLIAAKATSAGLYPHVVLYGPDYSPLAAANQSLDEVLSESGTYTLVIYDGYSGYGDDSLQDTGDYNVSLTCLAPPPDSPDLVVSSLEVSPNSVVPGETATVSWTVENAGILAATPTGYWLEVRLSDDTVYDGSDTLIGQTQITEVLDPGDETSGTYALATAGLAEGTYYAVAMVDATDIVDEGSEANNTASSSPVHVGEVYYDLEVSSTDWGDVTTPGEGTFTYLAGTSVSVTAEADPGYKLVYWELDGTPVAPDNPLTVTIDADHTLRANFDEDEIVLPEVMTEPAENVTCNSAWISATLVYDGGEECECLFRYWGQDGTEDYIWYGSATSGATFGSSLANLTPGRTYYYVADADNSAGSASGEILSFTTAVRLTISATTGGAVVEPNVPVVELPTAGRLWVAAEADPGYLFWHWAGSAAEAGKVTPNVTSPGANVLVDADDTLTAVFLKRAVDASDRNPAPCRGTEGSTSQYWGFDGEGDRPPANVYELTGVPKNGRPPLPGTSLEPDESAGGDEQWWAVDDQPDSDRTGLLALPAMRVSASLSPSADTATTVWVQCVWRPYDDGEEGAAEPLLLDAEPAPFDPPLLTQEVNLGNGWRHSTYVWTVAPSPKTVAFTLTGRIVVDALIVDTCAESIEVIHVDDDAPLDPGPNDMAISDPLEDGTAQHPFDSIQEGIDAAIDGTTVLVHAGRYPETIDLSDKGITVTAEWLWDASTSAASVLDAGGTGPAVQFVGPQETPSVLSGLAITGARAPTEPAIVCNQASPLISHCLIAGNMATAPGGVVAACRDSQARFVNCTVSGNRAGPDGAVLSFADSEATVVNSIVWGNEGPSLAVGQGATPGVLYSDIAGGWSGPGIFDLDPSFARPGSWLSHGTADPSDDTWLEGDYHLQSQYGRLNPEIEAWVLDAITSPCVDTGDPQSMSGREPTPNGGRANLGMYGATQQASKSPASDL